MMGGIRKIDPPLKVTNTPAAPGTTRQSPLKRSRKKAPQVDPTEGTAGDGRQIDISQPSESDRLLNFVVGIGKYRLWFASEVCQSIAGPR